MSAQETITLYYAPQTRATGARVLLEELGVPYKLHVLNLKTGENHQRPYLDVNPLGKVPVIDHGEAVVTEQAAIYIYLSEAFPEAGLSPAVGDPKRADFLRWIAFYAACFEPAVTDRYRKIESKSSNDTPYGTFDGMIRALESALRPGPYLLGDTFSAADILWGLGLKWTMMFGLVPGNAVFDAYVERITARPAFRKVAEEDVRMAAELEAAAEQPKAEAV